MRYAAACSIWALKTGSDQHELIFVHVLRMLSIAIEAWFHFENPHPAAWPAQNCDMLVCVAFGR